MKRMPVSFLLMCFLVAETSFSLPRFASRTGAKCQSCHVNPSGGGMRQAFGLQYGREALPVPTWSEELGLDDFSTKLSEFVSIGADVRTLFYAQQIPDSATGGSVTNNAFFQMQGDVYMNFRLARKVSIYIDKGIYSGFEIFGLLSILPANGHIKIGKFVPNYGTKVDDHRTFIRDQTGFSPERGRSELTGGEVGISPGPVSITAGVYNAADGFGGGGSSNKAFLGRAEGIFKLSEDLFLGLGGNVFSREGSSGSQTTLFGGIGSLSYGDLTISGEVDWIRNKVAGTTTTGLVSYVEAGYVVTTGVDLKFIYEFYDPNIDVKAGAVSRYSFGFEFFPVSGVEVRPVYRISHEDPVDLKNNEFNLLIHFYL
ncbi:MAG: hypothetical protein KIT19_05520 [Phycisphaeraceae bacterium]|nr:hypothetical protein [Bacteroidota bacterium]MCW5768122.1 hypothetical protein [Phycisphaeraceae bacterium]